METAAEEQPPFRTEYAKSGRASCKGCREPIAKESLRMAKMVQSPHFDGKIPHWYHFSCFFKGKTTPTSVSQVGGMGGIRWEDQQMIQEKIDGKTGVVTGQKRKGSDKPDGKSVKKAKKTESAEEKALREQNELIWKIRDELQENLSKRELTELLEANNQVAPVGESKILDSCADGMVFGALDKCDTCGGQLSVRTYSYHCTGNISSWTKCTVTTTEAKRKKWIIPKHLKEYPFLKSYKYQARKCVFPEAPPTPSSSMEACSSSGSQSISIDPTKPLAGFKIYTVGRLSKTKVQLTDEIKSLGGTVTSSVNKLTTVCISNKAEIDKMGSNMAKVKDCNVPVVDVEYLDDAASGDVFKKIPSHTISSWGGPRLSLPSKEETDFGLPESLYEKVPMTMKMKIKGGAAVDPDSGLENSHHVFEQHGEVFNAVLGMVDIVRGTNSYYKLQLLESDKGRRYFLFRAWGRVGTTIGGNKLEDFGSDFDDAIDQFKDLYEEKTGHNWIFRKGALKVPGKFYPLEIDYGEDDDAAVALSTAGTNSKLASEIQELVKMIFDIESMKKAMMEFEIDMKKMPLGKLSKRQIQAAYAVLTELQSEITGAKNPAKLLDGSNRFYTLIPHDFGMQKPPLLNTEEAIKTKTTMLDNLMEIEIAYSLLKTDDEAAETGKDPLDIHYEKLKTKMSVLDKESEEFQRLVEYVANTHATTHSQYKLEVMEIFKIERHGETKRYKPFTKLDNRMLLWHGSRLTNYAGILSQGLRIAPPEAPMTGYMFGKGVYFADMVSKSANYCRTSSTDPIGLMLLCEVALGNMYERKHAEYVSELPPGKHSTKGIGRTAPDPSGDFVTESGAVMPMGKGKDTSFHDTSLLYNEYIVYDVAQINMKYLFKMNFKFRY